MLLVLVWSQVTGFPDLGLTTWASHHDPVVGWRWSRWFQVVVVFHCRKLPLQHAGPFASNDLRGIAFVYVSLLYEIYTKLQSGFLSCRSKIIKPRMNLLFPGKSFSKASRQQARLARQD